MLNWRQKTDLTLEYVWHDYSRLLRPALPDEESPYWTTTVRGRKTDTKCDICKR